MNLIKCLFAGFIACTTLGAEASSTKKYLLTITNGGLMPISPAVIYVKNGQGGGAQIGSEPTMGFAQLCQTGDRSTRMMEVKNDMNVTSVAETMFPLLSGESKTVEIEVQNPSRQSLHFESMYGKTKDICAVGSIGGQNLYALRARFTSEVIANDKTLLSGAFLDPALPVDQSEVCETATSAANCLRELSSANPQKKQIRFFAGYLPSVLNFLETKYGSEDVKTLLLTTSGAIQLQLKLKH